MSLIVATSHQILGSSKSIVHQDSTCYSFTLPGTFKIFIVAIQIVVCRYWIATYICFVNRSHNTRIGLKPTTAIPLHDNYAIYLWQLCLGIVWWGISERIALQSQGTTNCLSLIPDSIIMLAMYLTPLLMTALVSMGVGDSSSTIYLSAPGISHALPHFLMAGKGAPTATGTSIVLLRTNWLVIPLSAFSPSPFSDVAITSQRSIMLTSLENRPWQRYHQWNNRDQNQGSEVVLRWRHRCGSPEWRCLGIDPLELIRAISSQLLTFSS